MKKIIALLLTAIITLSLFACSQPEQTPEETDYEKFMKAAVGDTVTVETYVQATQSWWADKITIYAEDQNGAYLFYETACSEEDAAKLTPGTKIKVTGPKAEYAGELEISGGTLEIIEEATKYVAEPTDVTAKVGTDDLIKFMNRKVVIKNAEVIAYEENGAAIEHKYGERGDDIYFKVKVGETVVNMCIERYLTDPDTDVYKAVEALQVGDKIDIECFLYWYNGANPHVTSVKAAQ